MKVCKFWMFGEREDKKKKSLTGLARENGLVEQKKKKKVLVIWQTICKTHQKVQMYM